MKNSGMYIVLIMLLGVAGFIIYMVYKENKAKYETVKKAATIKEENEIESDLNSYLDLEEEDGYSMRNAKFGKAN